MATDSRSTPDGITPDNAHNKTNIPRAVHERFQNPKRAEVRLKAAADAAALIRGTETWDAQTLSRLLQHINTDWVGNKLLKNRYGPGLIGSNEKKLVNALDKLQPWMALVRATDPLDDQAVERLYREYWDRGIPNPFLFPSAVFAALEPDRFPLYVKPLVQATAKIAGRVLVRKKEPHRYLDYAYALRELCEENNWRLCLADAALLGFDPPKAPPKHKEFEGFSAETIELLRELKDHTQDAEWHRENYSRYVDLLREPTRRLVQTIGQRYISPLDPKVASVSRPQSILKKNDYGGDSYHPNYWFAFYDPQAESKTRSVQLFLYMLGDLGQYRYGFGLGAYCAPHLKKLLDALEAKRDEFVAYLGSLPDEAVVVHRRKADDQDLAPVAEIAAAVKEKGVRGVFREEEIEALEIAVNRTPLEGLKERGPGLADDVGQLFTALWPMFDAGRTGEFVWQAAPPGSTISEPSKPLPPYDTELELDEDAPETVAELAKITNIPEERLEEMEEALLAKGQVVLVGPPGTSKTYLAQQFARYFARYRQGERPQGKHHVLYMHASWGYEDFFEGLRPKADVDGLQFERRNGAFLDWVDKAQKIPAPAQHVLVLDEINRCDTAAVLGELLQLMEYRGRTVQLLSGRAFVFPENLFIIGTMNSADRSVGRMDLALRRRFFFFDLMPDTDVLAQWLNVAERNTCGFDAEALKQCNAYLQSTCGIPREQQIGHALFMPSGVESTETDEVAVQPLTPSLLRQIVSYSVLPYVRELMLERGRDPASAAKKVVGFFDGFWKTMTDDEDEEGDADEETTETADAGEDE